MNQDDLLLVALGLVGVEDFAHNPQDCRRLSELILDEPSLSAPSQSAYHARVGLRRRAQQIQEAVRRQLVAWFLLRLVRF